MAGKQVKLNIKPLPRARQKSTIINKGVNQAYVDNAVDEADDVQSIGSPTYTTLKQLRDVMDSAGLISGGELTNNGDGTIDVDIGQGQIRATDDTLATIFSCTWLAATSLALTDVSFSYIYVEYNSGVPQVVATTTERTDTQTNILLGGVYRDGNEIHLTSEIKHDINDSVKKIIARFSETEPFRHASGGILSETGTRNIATSAGVFYYDLCKVDTIAQDTSGSSPDLNHTFEYFYYDGANWITHEEAIAAVAFTGSGLDDATSGGTFVGSHTIRIHVEIDANGTPDTFKWSYKDNDGITVVEVTGVPIVSGAMNLVDGATITFAATTGHTIGDAWDFDCTLSSQIDATQYNNIATGLATLGVNKYGVHWVYLDVHGHVAVLFGQGNYTLTQANEAGAPASVPVEFIEHTRLIGKIIIKKSDATFTTVENNYDSQFQGSQATDHNATAGLQGGTAAEYYHLTSAEHALVPDQSVDIAANPSFATPIVTTKLDLTGGQITFPATQIPSADANTLDDVEEGTFTPTIQDSSFSDGEGQTYTTQDGQYQKLGNRCHFQFYLVVSSKGSLTAGEGLVIGNLPFTANNGTTNFASVDIGYGINLNLAAAGKISGYVSPNTSRIIMQSWNATAGVTAMLVSEINATVALIVSGSYKT